MNSPAVTGFRQISDFASIFLLRISLITRENHENGWYFIQKYPGVVWSPKQKRNPPQSQAKISDFDQFCSARKTLS